MTVLPNSGCCLQSFTPYLLWDLIFQRNVLSQCSDTWKLLYLKILGENPSNVHDPMISLYAVSVCPAESGCPVTCEMTSSFRGCGQGGLHGTGVPPEVKCQQVKPFLLGRRVPSLAPVSTTWSPTLWFECFRSFGQAAPGQRRPVAWDALLSPILLCLQVTQQEPALEAPLGLTAGARSGAMCRSRRVFSRAVPCCPSRGLHRQQNRASRPPSPVQSPCYAAEAQIIREAEAVKSMQSTRIIIISEI